MVEVQYLRGVDNGFAGALSRSVRLNLRTDFSLVPGDVEEQPTWKRTQVRPKPVRKT